jgi:hypothetical protein
VGLVALQAIMAFRSVMQTATVGVVVQGARLPENSLPIDGNEPIWGLAL